jgi:hypothetical protein
VSEQKAEEGPRSTIIPRPQVRSMAPFDFHSHW